MSTTLDSMVPPQPQGHVVPPWRLVLTLAGAGALAGLLIVLVFQWAQPRILHHQARATAAAIDEVLASPTRTQTLFLWQGAYTPAVPAGADTVRLEKIWAGYGDDGRLIGYAVIGAEPGFQDVIRLMFGYDPVQRRVLGMRVLENKETPGLGDKIVKDSTFVQAFNAAVAPLLPVKPGTQQGAEGEVQTITGATISSRAVIGIINRRIEQIAPLLGAVQTR
jgi:electron transport complex protein RnfG